AGGRGVAPAPRSIASNSRCFAIRSSTIASITQSASFTAWSRLRACTNSSSPPSTIPWLAPPPPPPHRTDPLAGPPLLHQRARPLRHLGLGPLEPLRAGVEQRHRPPRGDAQGG